MAFLRLNASVLASKYVCCVTKRFQIDASFLPPRKLVDDHMGVFKARETGGESTDCQSETEEAGRTINRFDQQHHQGHQDDQEIVLFCPHHLCHTPTQQAKDAADPIRNPPTAVPRRNSQSRRSTKAAKALH